MAGFRILLIEDDPWDVKIFKRIMSSESASFDFLSANCLSEGLKIIQEQQVDLILLDLGLPDSNGLETLTPVLNVAQHIPIIVVTGSEDEELPVKAVEMGAHDYLIKEMIDNQSLKRAIRYAIERHILLTEIHSKEHKLEQSRLQFKRYLENNIVSTVVINREGIVRYANKAAGKLFDRKAEDWIGHPFDYSVDNNFLEILKEDGHKARIEMQVYDAEWEDEEAIIASLKHVDE